MVQATQDYFKTLHSRSDEVLSALLSKSVNEASDILLTEQVIQDYMAAVFQPFVGSWRIPGYIQESAPRTFLKLRAAADKVIAGRIRFGLVGAHYRSSLSAKGRRSAFALHRRSLSNSLRDLLGDHPYIERWKLGRKDFLGILWEAVYLEQYFALFDRKLTLGEWAFEQNKKIPIVVLSEHSTSAKRLEEFRSDPNLKQVIVLPERLTGVLLNNDLLSEFAKGVADGIVGAFERDPNVLSQLVRCRDGYPDKERISSWSRLVRSANALARDSIVQRSIERELSLRHSYATGLLLYHPLERELCEELLCLFPGVEPDSAQEQGPVESDQLSRLLRVFQSLQFYTRRYGENCVTFPYRGTETVSGVVPRKTSYLSGERVNSEYHGEGFQSSVTLFWKGSRNLDLLNEIVEGARGIFSQLTTLVDNHIRTRRIEASTPRQEDTEVVKMIRESSGGQLSGNEVHEVLAAARDLSRALHEGKPRAFSFILGSPEWLISDLSVVHDLMSSALRYQVTQNPSQPLVYERTLALLRGNSAFFQDDSLALFLPYLGLPLEVTHVVRLPRDGTGRRQLLSSFSKKKKAVIAIATYGSGSGEVIHDGEVRAVLSADGQWIPTDGYQRLVYELRVRIHQLSDEATAQKLIERLEPCLRRISEEPGVGGLFIIARERAANWLKRDSISLTEVLESIDGRSLPELDTSAVYNLARDDGATIIAVPSMRVWGRRLLPSGSASGRSKEPIPASDSSLAEQIQALEWGTRRRTASRVSRNLASEGLAVVISADGPINVLQGGVVVSQFGERIYVHARRNGTESETFQGATTLAP
jgi:hypothetical protein